MIVLLIGAIMLIVGVNAPEGSPLKVLAYAVFGVFFLLCGARVFWSVMSAGSSENRRR